MKKYVMEKNRILECLVDFSKITDHQGVVGTTRLEDGLPEYIYGEITGYFLSFCSYVCKRHPAYRDNLSSIMSSHVNWLMQLVKNGFVTRCSINSKADWRNSAVFAFDIAMIIRGLRDSATIVDSTEALALYLEKFNSFIDYDNKALMPFINGEKEAMPDKWSTRRDCHYAKIVASVLPVLYEKNCRIEFDILKRELLLFDNYDINKMLNVDSHPLLYYMEGIMMASKMDCLPRSSSTEYIERIASLYKELLGLTEGKGLLDNPINGNYRRSDVLAQFVRIGALLYMQHELSSQEIELIGKVLDCILEDFYIDGKVLFFDKRKPRNNVNTWCAMFLYQAMDFYQISRSSGLSIQEHLLWDGLF